LVRVQPGELGVGEPPGSPASPLLAVRHRGSSHAREVGQTHSRLVTIARRDGGRRYTREPHIDDVGAVVNEAMKTCGPFTFWTE
jgi:hypothetical protein